MRASRSGHVDEERMDVNENEERAGFSVDDWPG